jgi:hypothetical membrane protein
MTATGIGHDVRSRHWPQPSGITRRGMLACGIAASLLYAVTDLLAGLHYDGYSFYSQTISELGAIGAPKPSWLFPLFLAYDLLMVAFAIAVLLEGKRVGNRLTVVGGLLLAYMVVGAGTAFFPVHVRGTATLADELPHIVAGLFATAVMLVTMGFGSAALGKRFQLFSWAIVASILVFGGLTVPSGIKLAAGEPTPGMGVLERLAYYSILLWIAALSVGLVRRAGVR